MSDPEGRRSDAARTGTGTDSGGFGPRDATTNPAERVDDGVSRIHRTLVVVAVVALVAGAAGTVAVAQNSTTPATGSATLAADGTNETNETTAGARLAGLAGVQGVEVQGSVDLAAYDVRLERAETPEARADVVAAQLRVTNRHLTTLARRVETLTRAREEESIDHGEYVARMAEVGAAVDRVQTVLDRSRRATEALPADRRADLDDRIREQRTRATDLEARTADAAGTIAGSDEAGAAPVAAEDVAAAVERSGSRAPGSLRTLFGDERVTVHVRQADGRVNRYHLRISDGRVVDSGTGPGSNPTLHLYTHHATVREVRDAEDPWAATDRAFAEDRITYRGAGLVGGVKYGLLSVVQDVYEALRGVLSWAGLA